MDFLIPGRDFEALASSIIYFPLGSAILLLLFGGYLESRSQFSDRVRGWTGWIATLSLARSFIAAVMLFLELVKLPEHERRVAARVFDWITVGDVDTGVDLLVDPLAVVMVLVVTGVGTLIHLYSISYMAGDAGYPRYFAYLNLFAAAMLLLVLADNILLLYVGWEGVGLCSYLLIGFWFGRSAAHNAAKKAFIVNRIGDFSFLLGILLLLAHVGTLDIGSINAAAGAMTAGVATAAALLLFGGATGKSAQIPLYVWLPDAMEGPTPVSALIHAATMVTAGVYLVARFSPVFAASGIALDVVAWIGILTALLAALMAAAEYDIKRVLAYSTISQIGYMFLAAGVGAFAVAIFHLVTHAFFKALMFLGAGSVMHALAGETDMRAMGGLRKLVPVTGWTFLAGWLAISGVFPFAGFWSKDAILATTWDQGRFVLYAIGLATAALTAFYMSRLYLRVFEGPVKQPSGTHPHEAPPTMAVVLVVLGALSVVGGAINLPGALTLEHFLEPVVGHLEAPSGAIAWLLGGLALLVAAGGIAVAYAVYLAPQAATRRAAVTARLSWIVGPARDKFYVDAFYGRWLVRPAKAIAANAAYVFDPRFIDGTINGLARIVAGSSEWTRRIQTGYVRSYAAFFFLGAVAIFSVVLLRSLR